MLWSHWKPVRMRRPAVVESNDSGPFCMVTPDRRMSVDGYARHSARACQYLPRTTSSGMPAIPASATSMAVVFPVPVHVHPVADAMVMGIVVVGVSGSKGAERDQCGGKGKNRFFHHGSLLLVSSEGFLSTMHAAKGLSNASNASQARKKRDQRPCLRVFIALRRVYEAAPGWPRSGTRRPEHGQQGGQCLNCLFRSQAARRHPHNARRTCTGHTGCVLHVEATTLS